MDADLKTKKFAADAALSRCEPEDREAVLAYVAALELYEVQYQILRRSVDEFVRLVVSGQFLGPRFVERRADGQAERRGPARGNGVLLGVEELEDPGALRRPEGAVVDAQVERPVPGQGMELEQVGGGCGVEELAGHGPSEDI